MINQTKYKEPIKYNKLTEVLPLPTPYCILIDPCNVCNFRCSFCPAGYPDLLRKVSRPKGMMELALFFKVIDDIADFGEKIKVIALYKDGEPFLNEDLVKMIIYAKKKNIADRISVTSNGSRIDETKALQIIDSGLSVIKISIEHVNSEGYKNITKNYSDYDRIRKNVEFLYSEKEKRGSKLEVRCKINDLPLTDLEKEKFINDFKPISDHVYISNLMGWNNQNGIDFSLGKDYEKDKNTQYANTTAKSNWKVCPELFYKMAVNFDGTVSPCCGDWSHGALIGDVKKNRLIDIWRGEILKSYRLQHLNGEKDRIDVCATCDMPNFMAEESDLDGDSEILYEKFVNYDTAICKN